MDGELFRRLYRACGKVASRVAARRCSFSDFEVLLTFVLAAAAHKPLSWACRRCNWPLWCWRVKLPTPSTLSRRTRTRHFRLLLLSLDAALKAQLPGSSLKMLDGMALLVGGYSRDPDARRGRAPGGWGKGYKLHAVIDACGAVDLFTVTGLDAGESTVARQVLVPALPAACDLRGALVLADGNFDSNHLYGAVAAARGSGFYGDPASAESTARLLAPRLLAPRRKPGTGLGHGTEQHPDRLRGIDELERTPGGREQFDRLRLGVEQAFGLMTYLGLGALPPWVRRLRRVRLWVMAKVIVYHAHLLQQDARRAA
jgi:hypothetical protein